MPACSACDRRSRKGLVRIAGSPELGRLKSERVADVGNHARDRRVDGRGSEKPQGRQVVVIV